MKHRLVIFLTLLLLISASGGARAAADITVTLDGKALQFEQEPVVVNQRTLVPMRAIFEALGAQVEWDGATHTVTATKGDTKIRLEVGSKKAVKDGKEIQLEAESQSVNGHTMVPVRFVSEALAANVTWNEAKKTVVITTQQSDTDTPVERPHLSVAEITANNEGKVVVLETASSKGPLATGSAVAIKDGLFLTSAHVLQGATKASIKTADGKEYDVQGWVVSDQKQDLAVIKTKEKPGLDPVWTGSAKKAQKGEHIVTIGSPKGLANTVSEGIISEFRTMNGIDLVKTTAPIAKGSSGGAIFNDRGELIGITGTVSGEGNSGVAVAIDNIGNWLQNELAAEFDTLQASFAPTEQQPNQPPESPTASQMQTKLEQGYSILSTSRAKFDIGGWDVAIQTDLVTITANIDPDEYGLYVRNYSTVNPELKKWAESIGKLLDEQYPDQHVTLTIFYRDTYPFKPSSFEENEVTKLDGNWSVVHQLISVSLTDMIRWNLNP